MKHPPDPATCPECAALVTMDGLDLSRFCEVEHRPGYSLLRLRSDPLAVIRWMARAAAPVP